MCLYLDWTVNRNKLCIHLSSCLYNMV